MSDHVVVYERYIEDREDGGTPGILQAIKAGLAFELKEKMMRMPVSDASDESILEAYDHVQCMRTIKAWREHPCIQLVGSDRAAYFAKERLPIISFNLLFPPDVKELGSNGDSEKDLKGNNKMMRDGDHGSRVLHPHFVCAVLNDLYGISSRSGCSCTGPYGYVHEFPR